MKEKVYEIVIAEIKAINDMKQFSKSIDLAMDSKLFGPGSPLDSLGLVNLIVSVEQRIEDEFEVSLTIADERAMQREKSPFRTVGGFVEYIIELLKEEGCG